MRPPLFERTSSLKKSETAELVADKRGDLHYLGSMSISSITSEAQTIAEQKLKSKLARLSGRSRTEASDILRRTHKLKSSASSVLLEDEFGNLNVSGTGWWLPDRNIAATLCLGGERR